MRNKTKQIQEAIERLEKWFDKNGLYGWDPYDIQDSNPFRVIEKYLPNIVGKVFIRLLSELAFVFPLSCRKILGVNKSVNNKGLGLMLASYASYYEYSSNPKHLDQAIHIADYLEENANNEYTGMSWGYPFDWLSPLMIPAGMPSSVVTSIVGDGFYRLYLATQNKKYLDICEKICVFFMENLTITHGSDDSSSICYSYTPLDDYQVHNANLFVGEFLIRVGKIKNRKALIDQGVRCANFAFEEQTEEGFIPYWGLSQTEKYSHGRLHTDHYHCGFEIRSLHSIWLNTGISRFHDSFNKYLKWYRNNMFSEDGIPKYNAENIYPYNIHTCSEAILCLSKVAKDSDDKGFVVEMASTIVNEMEYSPGKYTHLIKNRFNLLKVRSNIPLLRWGQAWMFLALIDLQSLLDEE